MRRKPGRLRLVGTAGVMWQQITIKSRIFTISPDGYPAGMYLLHTFGGKEVKLVKG